MVARVVRRQAAPSCATAPVSGAHSAVDGLGTVAEQLGAPLWPWQRSTARVALERRAGRWRYPIVTVCVPRQSGKTTLVGLLAIHRCMTESEISVWYTAQSRMDAVSRFRDFVRLMRRSEFIELASGVRNPGEYSWDYRVRFSAGAEVLEFGNGSTLQIFAPAEDSLHGSVADLIVFDEARFFDEATGRELMAAAMPTMATRDGQLWIVSTGGGPESTFLAGELERSRAELDTDGTRRAHFEYSIGYDVPDSELLDAVWSAHPAAGQKGGPVRDALAVAAEAMPPSQFAHEYGNRWRSADESRLIPSAAWARSAWAQLPDAGDVFLAADVAADRSSSAVVACVGAVVHVLDYRPGVTWLADRVIELAEEHTAAGVWIEPGGPSGSTALELDARLPSTHLVSTRELTAACGAFEDSALATPPELGHTPSDALDAAVAAATHRRIGQAWAWSRVDSGPVLTAASLALGAYRAAQRAPDLTPAIW